MYILKLFPIIFFVNFSNGFIFSSRNNETGTNWVEDAVGRKIVKITLESIEDWLTFEDKEIFRFKNNITLIHGGVKNLKVRGITDQRILSLSTNFATQKMDFVVEFSKIHLSGIFYMNLTFGGVLIYKEIDCNLTLRNNTIGISAKVNFDLKEGKIYFEEFDYILDISSVSFNINNFPLREWQSERKNNDLSIFVILGDFFDNFALFILKRLEKEFHEQIRYQIKSAIQLNIKNNENSIFSGLLNIFPAMTNLDSLF